MDTIATLLIRAKKLKKYNNIEAANIQLLRILDHEDFSQVCSAVEKHYNQTTARTTSYMEDMNAGPDIELDAGDVQDLKDDIIEDDFDYRSSKDNYKGPVEKKYDPSLDMDEGIEIEFDEEVLPEDNIEDYIAPDAIIELRELTASKAGIAKADSIEIDPKAEKFILTTLADQLIQFLDNNGYSYGIEVSDDIAGTRLKRLVEQLQLDYPFWKVRGHLVAAKKGDVLNYLQPLLKDPEVSLTTLKKSLTKDIKKLLKLQEEYKVVKTYEERSENIKALKASVPAIVKSDRYTELMDEEREKRNAEKENEILDLTKGKEREAIKAPTSSKLLVSAESIKAKKKALLG